MASGWTRRRLLFKPDRARPHEDQLRPSLEYGCADSDGEVVLRRTHEAAPRTKEWTRERTNGYIELDVAWARMPSQQGRAVYNACMSLRLSEDNQRTEWRVRVGA